MIPKRFIKILSITQSQVSFPIRIKFSYLFLGLLAIILGGCYTLDVVKAFDGKFPPEQANKMIIEYCQSCHIHKDFVPQTHLETVKKNYRQKKFQEATECRTCHYVQTQFMRNELIRKTKRPNDVSRVDTEKK